MINGILILHIIITALLIGVVLIQKSEGGALGMGGGAGGGFMTTRGTANLLTRVTGVLAVLFFITTLSLAILFKGESKPKSLLEEAPAPTVPVVTTEAPLQDAGKESAEKAKVVESVPANTPKGSADKAKPSSSKTPKK
jgi:preprotein translocase subunit SecG